MKNYTYKEDISAGNSFRNAYLAGITGYIEDMKSASAAAREANIMKYFTDSGFDSEAARHDFYAMLGGPLVYGEFPAAEAVSFYPVAVSGDYEIIRCVFEICGNIPFYGILFRRLDCEGKALKAPLILSLHGGLGTPELCSGLFGSSANYNDITYRVTRYGVHAFAPQTLFWRDKQFGNTPERQDLDRKLRYIGCSMVSLELYGMMAAVTALSSEEYVDPERIGITGLSYGGSNTLYMEAADTRMKSAAACSFFSDRSIYDWQDVTFFNSMNTFGDAEIALLAAPRCLHIMTGDRDELFDWRHAQSEYWRLRRYWTLAGFDADRLSFTVFSGTHEYIKDDDILDRLIADLG